MLHFPSMHMICMGFVSKMKYSCKIVVLEILAGDEEAELCWDLNHSGASLILFNVFFFLSNFKENNLLKSFKSLFAPF